MSPQKFPIIVCPECRLKEPGAYIGESSGDVVCYPQEHFADHRGFLHCYRCGVVWGVLHELPEAFAVDVPIDERGLRGGSFFKPEDAERSQYFRRLFRVHALNAGGFGHSNRVVERTNDRIYDAEALCSMLDLPSQVTATVVNHVRLLSTRADFRTLAASASGTVRSEALIVATVALVMERCGVERERGLGRMLQAFRFKRGNPSVTVSEYEAAYLACAKWFGRNLWRDAPEDFDSSTSTQTKEN